MAWDTYDNAMGGGLLGNLTEEEKRRLRMQSLGAFGAGLLDHSGWSPVPQTMGQGMAQGMANAQGAYQQGASDLTAYKDRQVQRDAALAKQQQEAEAKAELERLVSSGEPITPQAAMKIVALAPSLSNVVQQAMKVQGEGGKEKLPLSVIGKQVYDMGIQPGTPEWQSAYSQALSAARAPKGGGDKPSAIDQKIALAQQMGASPEEIKAMVLGRSYKDSGEGGRVVPRGALKDISAAAQNVESFSRLSSNFKPEYAGNTMTGGLENLAGRLGGEAMGVTDEGQTQWWQDYQAQANAIRNDLFGAALTAQEKTEFDKAMINPRMDPAEIQKNLARQSAIYEQALARASDPYRAGGFDQSMVDAAAGRPGSAPQTPGIKRKRFNPESGMLEDVQ
jgi:hypothetical protein